MSGSQAIFTYLPSSAENQLNTTHASSSDSPCTRTLRGRSGGYSHRSRVSSLICAIEKPTAVIPMMCAVDLPALTSSNASPGSPSPASATLAYEDSIQCTPGTPRRLANSSRMRNPRVVVAAAAAMNAHQSMTAIVGGTG